MSSTKFVLLCCLYYLVSAAGGGVAGDSDGRPQRFLRAAAADASVDESAASAAATSVQEAAVTEPSHDEPPEEEFDYETYHARHKIPVPALGAATMMMGFANGGAGAAASVESSVVAGKGDEGVDEATKPAQTGASSFPYSGILAFSGTSEAMKQFASSSSGGGVQFSAKLNDDDDDSVASGYSEGGDDAEQEEVNNNSAASMMATLAQISKSRSSMMFGSLDTDEGSTSSSSATMGGGAGDDGPDETAKFDNDDSSAPQQSSDDSDSNEGDVVEVYDPRPRKTLPRTQWDLDRGRHMVGLEVRDVRPHQQIIVDYGDGEDDGQLQSTSPRRLRINFILVDGKKKKRGGEGDAGTDANGAAAQSDAQTTEADATSSEVDNHGLMLQTLLNTSFNRTAILWSRALSLPKRPPSVEAGGYITPTVPKCGAATVPPAHREMGVPHADLVVYVTGSNRFCGGALMHSSVCDYDQNMRPLVANLNICTRNIPATTVRTPEHGEVQIVSSATLAEYDEYVSAEVARILGASTSLFRNYRNVDTGLPYGASERDVTCVDGTRERLSLPNVVGERYDDGAEGAGGGGQQQALHYEIRTPKVIEVMRNHFDCMTLTGARLEVKRVGGLSCYGGFLDEVSCLCL